MKLDLFIKNGHIIDVSQGIDGIMDIGILSGKIMGISAGTPIEYENCLDASGLLVVPGLIDFHTHLFPGVTESGVPADAALLGNGITAAVDAGSSGTNTAEQFTALLKYAAVKTKAFLHVSPTGQYSKTIPEKYNSAEWDEELTKSIFENHSDRFLGFKMRTSKKIVGKSNPVPFYDSLAWAQKFQKPLVVHVTDPSLPIDEIADSLRPGDVFCHVYQGFGDTIINNGHISPSILRAHDRGVLLDAAHGTKNLDFSIARKAINDGLLPDIISSDITTRGMYYERTMGLPYIMSKFLALGISFNDILRAVTVAPAAAAGMKEDWGTLKNGTSADITILKEKSGVFTFTDAMGESLQSDRLLVPMATIIDGNLVYRNYEWL